MKHLLVAFISVAFLSCGIGPSKNRPEENPNKNSKFKPVDVTLEQLVGAWEITEIRTDPAVKGRKPTKGEMPFDIGFTGDGEMSTLPTEIDLSSDLNFIETKIAIEKGAIFPSKKYMKFEVQLGDALEVLLINDKELVLRSRGFGLLTSHLAKTNEFWYLTKIE
jgi:hypothetical protein